MARDIQTKLALEGVATFKQQMADAASSITTLNSESKLIEAQFSATGDKSQYLQDKIGNLKAKIEEQKTAVAAAEQALASLKTAGLDPSSQAVQQWQTKLNNAKTKLVNMQTELNNTETELGELDTSMASSGEVADTTSDQLAQIGKAVSIEGALTSLQGIEKGLTSIIDKAAKAVKALIDVGADAAGWADDLLTESQTYGIDPTTIQQMRYASKMIDTDVGTIESSMTRATRSTAEAANGSATYAEAFAQLGVEYADANGEARNSADVFWDIIDVMHNGATSTEDYAAAMQILGRNAQELNPLIQAGSEAYRDLMEAAPTVGDEQVIALGQAKDAMDDLESQIEVTKMELLASLAPAFEAGAKALSEFVQQFREFMATEQGQAALEALNKAMTNLINSLTSEENIATIFTAVETAINAVKDVIQWLADNSDAVAEGIKVIGGAFATLKVSESVLSFVKLAQSARGLFGGGGSSVATSAASNGGSILKSAGTGLASLGAKVLPAAAAAAPYVVFLGATMYGAHKLDQYATERDWGEYNRNIDDMAGLSAAASGTGNEKYAEIIDELQQVWDKEEDERYDYLLGVLQKYEADINEALPDLDFAPDDSMWFDELADLSKEVVNGLSDKIREGVSGESAAATESASALGADTANAANEAVAEGATEAGAQLPAGIATGLEENSQVALDAAAALADQITNIINEKLQIASPSKVMAESGRFVAEGLALGIAEATGQVERAAAGMARAAQADVSYDTPAFRAASGGGEIHAVLNVDGQQLGEIVAPAVDRTLGVTATQRR